MLRLFALAAGLVLGGSAQAESLISARSVDGFAAQLAAMGHKTESASPSGEIPVLSGRIGSQPTAFAFGGCTDRRNCSYVVLSTTFTDVSPPLDWANGINTTYDLVSVTRNDEGKLSIRSGIAMGDDGIPVTTLRFVLDQWQAALAEIAQEAVKAGIVSQ